MNAQIVWNRSFFQNKDKKLAKVQEYIDSEVIDRMTEFVPVARPFWHNAGKLRDSVLNTFPGMIIYTAPFARRDYYKRVNHQHGGNPDAQRMWFEPTKEKYGRLIFKGAQELLNK